MSCHGSLGHRCRYGLVGHAFFCFATPLCDDVSACDESVLVVCLQPLGEISAISASKTRPPFLLAVAPVSDAARNAQVAKRLI